jgi:hypothetical protein
MKLADWQGVGPRSHSPCPWQSASIPRNHYVDQSVRSASKDGWLALEKYLNPKPVDLTEFGK